MKPMLRRTLALGLFTLACGNAAVTPTPAPPPQPAAHADEIRDSGGIGWLTAAGLRGETAAVELAAVHVTARQAGDYAALEIDHVFESKADVQLEGTFRFPLPEGALLTGLAMLIDGKLVEGELVEREKARKVYEQIVDSMQDPALLEWEHGTTFKMRVFPIAPGEKKRVTVRYLTPLQRRSGGWVFAQSTRRGSVNEPLPRLVIDWQDKRVVDEINVAPGRSFEVPASEPARVLREQRKDAAYTALRVRPDWSRVPVETRVRSKHWLFAVDTSRSSLEERKLALEALRAALAGLTPDQSFLVVTHDIEVRADPQGFSPARPESVAKALAFVEGSPADGATDLGTLLEFAGSATHAFDDATVVYIGDCEPTWGLLDADALSSLARRSLDRTRFNPIVIGSATDPELARELARVTGGRTLRADRPDDVGRFLRRLSEPAPRLPEVTVTAATGAEVFPHGKVALEGGDDLVLLVKTPPGKDALDLVTVTAKIRGREESLLERGPATETGFLAQRFGSELIRGLEQTQKPQAEIVETSLSYGVMSKYTSFLVLESEEAYARFAIERRAAREAQGPRVSGADLASLDGDGASVSLERIQPGDPEILVDAPADCRSVTVVFPFGVTKAARFDPEAGRGAWVVRFLVDRDTPEGVYEALAQIEHRDGARELRKVSYTVDRTAPELQTRVRPAPGRPGFLELSVTQRAPEAQRDLRRVEVRLPDGRTLRLTALRWAEFRGYIPTPARGAKLHVAGFDQALNHALLEVTLP